MSSAQCVQKGATGRAAQGWCIYLHELAQASDDSDELNRNRLTAQPVGVDIITHRCVEARCASTLTQPGVLDAKKKQNVSY